MYEPYTWTNGEVITAEKLNKLERGVEGALSNPLVIIDGEGAGDVCFLDVDDETEYTESEIKQMLTRGPVFTTFGGANGITYFEHDGEHLRAEQLLIMESSNSGLTVDQMSLWWLDDRYVVTRNRL